MTFYFNPDLCLPLLCSAVVVLTFCAVANTAVNIVNSVIRYETVYPPRRNRDRDER